MSISGTVPRFDYSTTSGASHVQTVVTVTGTTVGIPNGAFSSEALPEFFQRAINALAISGVLSGTGQTITAAMMSGVRAIQRELAFRVGDLTFGGDQANAKRLAASQAALAVSGEAQFGA